MEKPRHVNVGPDPDWVEKENKRLAKQAACSHVHYACRCGDCGAILFSDATEDTSNKWIEQVL